MTLAEFLRREVDPKPVAREPDDVLEVRDYVGARAVTALQATRSGIRLLSVEPLQLGAGGQRWALGRRAFSPVRLPMFTSWLVPGIWVLIGVYACYRMSLWMRANPLKHSV